MCLRGHSPVHTRPSTVGATKPQYIVPSVAVFADGRRFKTHTKICSRLSYDPEVFLLCRVADSLYNNLRCTLWRNVLCLVVYQVLVNCIITQYCYRVWNCPFGCSFIVLGACCFGVAYGRAPQVKNPGTNRLTHIGVLPPEAATFLCPGDVSK